MSDSDGDSSTPKLKFTKIKGLCDVCELPDGVFNLQKCVDCGVCVHDICYGIVHLNDEDDDDDDSDSHTKLENWKCHPCSGMFFLLYLGLYQQSSLCVLTDFFQRSGRNFLLVNHIKQSEELPFRRVQEHATFVQ